MEKAWECPSLTILAFRSDRLIPNVILLIAGLGAFPSENSWALGADEGCGICGQTETRSFIVHHQTCSLAGLNEAVAVGYVIVEHTELNGHQYPLLLGLRGGQNEAKTVLGLVHLAQLRLA